MGSRPGSILTPSVWIPRDFKGGIWPFLGMLLPPSCFGNCVTFTCSTFQASMSRLSLKNTCTVIKMVVRMRAATSINQKEARQASIFCARHSSIHPLVLHKPVDSSQPWLQDQLTRLNHLLFTNPSNHACQWLPWQPTCYHGNQQAPVATNRLPWQTLANYVLVQVTMYTCTCTSHHCMLLGIFVKGEKRRIIINQKKGLWHGATCECQLPPGRSRTLPAQPQ